MSRASRAARRDARHYLLTGERRWERFEATVIVAKSHADMAVGEAEMVAECEATGRSVEFVASSDVGCVRIYRIRSPQINNADSAPRA